MPSLVATKTAKKSRNTPQEHTFEKALLALESACLRISEMRSGSRDDTDSLYWQRMLKKIATPVSLALAECKGPRHFHNHYKHRADDDSVLTPVLSDPLEMLAQTCQSALVQSQQCVGMNDDKMRRACDSLEASLRGFLLQFAAK